MVLEAFPACGLYVVEGEVGLLMTAMRQEVHWYSHSHQVENQKVLKRALLQLNKVLNDAKTLVRIEPGILLAPFLDIIRSETTTGPVTSMALTAVNKIISYGLIDQNHRAVGTCVEAVVDAVTRAKFVGTDDSSDGVVLMQILQVLRALLLSPAGNHLSDQSVCEIMLSCFRISFETKHSELLQRTAQHCLRDMVQHLFVRLPRFADDNRISSSMEKMNTRGMENLRIVNNNQARIRTKRKKKLSGEYESQNLQNSVEEIKENYVRKPTESIFQSRDILERGIQNEPDSNKTQIAQEKQFSGIELVEEMKKKIHEPDGERLIVNKNSGIIEDVPGQFSGECIKGKACENLPEPSEVESSKPEGKYPTAKESLEIIDDVQRRVSGVHIKEKLSESLEKPSKVLEGKTDVNLKNSETGIPGNLSPDRNINGVRTSPKYESEPKILENYVNQRGVRFISPHQLAPYGVPCIRELFRFLVSICNPADEQNNEVMIHLGLSFLQIIFEVSADSLSRFPSLLAMIEDELSKNLILLLDTERISILAVVLQVSFILFESQREHLKFQFERFIIKLMEIVNSDSKRISQDQREMALETITRLLRIPELPAELYINYDCGLYSTNLCEDLMKFLSQNASKSMEDMKNIQIMSFDAMITLIDSIHSRCKDGGSLWNSSRHIGSSNLPTKDELSMTKAEKQSLVQGIKSFNESPRNRLSKLVEDGFLGQPENPDPAKITELLKENPMIDKKAIGEYLSRKENENVLDYFVKNFNFRNLRIDEALRIYLESFRLPGESALIYRLLDKFADHWYESNGQPLVSPDSATPLAYAVTMLNVDQHNDNVKRQGKPMNFDQFKQNCNLVSGGADFDQNMLEEIYNSIKNEEIIMPAEQTGLVKENFLWKVLMKRGAGPERLYLKVGQDVKFMDKVLVEITWAPIISVLCNKYNCTTERKIQQSIVDAFGKCAFIFAHYSMNVNLDALIVSLYEFTELDVEQESNKILTHLGNKRRCQFAIQTLFKVAHLHGDGMRNSWRNIIDCLIILYKSRLLPKSLTDGEDFVNNSGKVSLIREHRVVERPSQGPGILSSLYSFITLDTVRVPDLTEVTAEKLATDCIANCPLKEIIESSNSFRIDSLHFLIKSLVSVNLHDEDITVFLLEIFIHIIVQNEYRMKCMWAMIFEYIDGLLTFAVRENRHYLLERVTVCILKLKICLLQSKAIEPTILSSLAPLSHIPLATKAPLSRQISYGLFQLLKSGATNINSTENWVIIFSLLECAGAGSLAARSSSNTVLDGGNLGTCLSNQKPISPVSKVVLVSPTMAEAPLLVSADALVLDCELLPHDIISFTKCCESLTTFVHGVVTSLNIELCIKCVRTFAEAILQNLRKGNEAEKSKYQQSPMLLLNFMHALHTKALDIFPTLTEESLSTQTSSLWSCAWRPLLQGIARFCCDSRMIVRIAAITHLEKILIGKSMRNLSAVEWAQCLEDVLFPLLAKLLEPIFNDDSDDVEETRIRAAMLLSKVFLQNHKPLMILPGILPFWLKVLDLFMAYMHADNSEQLVEAIPEFLKNMLLVMSATEVLTPSSSFWEPTWRSVNLFLPNLKDLLFPDQPIEVHDNSEVSTASPDISPVRQKQLHSKSIVIQPEVFSEVSRRNPGFLTEIPIISTVEVETSSLSSSTSSILLLGQESQTKFILPQFEIPEPGESASVTTNPGLSLNANTQVDEKDQQQAIRDMLKHVSISPWRGRFDSVSLASSSGDTSSCESGSPTPAHTPPPSRASSCASLAPLTALSSFSPADNAPQQTTIKVYANCLRPDIEYKTLPITYQTTCHEIVQNLLNKYRMRHRDPRLFYLTMEVTVRRANVRTILPLDEDARPAVLQSCHPRGDSRFSLQTRRGGLVKIYDSALMSGSKYKSLLISERTTVDELIQMLLSCYNSAERVEQFSLYEVCEGEEYQRKLHPDDSPLKVTQKWTSTDRHLRIRRNPDYNPHRRKSMWASESTISAAISRLHLHNNHRLHHLPQQTINDGTKPSSISPGNNSHCMLLRQCTKNKNNNNRHDHNFNLCQSIGKPGSTSHQECIKSDPRVTKLSSLMPQSLPSTPLTSKHQTTSGYTDYENYLYI